MLTGAEGHQLTVDTTPEAEPLLLDTEFGSE